MRSSAAKVIRLPKQRQPKAGKWPKTLGECVDLLFEMRGERLDKMAEVDLISAREKLLREHLLETFKKSDIDGAKGKKATCSIIPSTVAHIEDYDKFTKWISKTGSWDMLQRRVNDKAFKLRLENGERVPGLKRFDFNKLSVTKRGGKGSKKVDSDE